MVTSQVRVSELSSNKPVTGFLAQEWLIAQEALNGNHDGRNRM